ncbi:DNA mismatch repair protein [Curvularia kusanoi]|uniref:DNA mismatch repair protein n=1 Tax=Curvularia kusanoi TaxID=90978 RepID=A0A9P4TLM6_CURKU|nr:DNA mismatch repair protein [Curvularia kusanoi]
MSIRPLPDGVAAQIKSSTTIVSLTGVVLELLKNSLDAKASKVTVTVDFARGSCTVEDDGLGIPPNEFSEEGGLGKLYFAAFNTSNATVAGQIQDVMAEKPSSAHLLSLLQIMTQADYITAAEWDSWVPLSASTPTVTVRGAISLDPAPNKYTQFISFGMRPLSSETWGNELYDQVNRLFALSDFGSVEDENAVDEQEQLRRLADKRYKKEGFTNRQLKFKKGIDRCPMFHLRVSLKNSRTTSMMEDCLAKDESSLKAVIGTVTAQAANLTKDPSTSGGEAHHEKATIGDRITRDLT